MQKIKRYADNPIIFIDDFYKVQQLFRSLKNRTDDMVFVISGRTPLISQSLTVLSQQAQFRPSQITILASLDELNDSELNAWKINMDRFNLWGSVDPQKVLRDTHKEFSRILVEYFEAKGIYRSFKDSLTSHLQSNQSVERIAIAILVSNILSSSVPLRTILNVLNQTISLQTKQDLSDFIDFEENKIRINTKVLSKMLLQDPEVFDASELSNTMVVMMTGYDKIQQVESTVFSAKKEMVSFSNLRLIIGWKRTRKSSLEEVESFYKNVQNLRFTSENPFFWIQFANSKMANSSWDMAKKYIDNAYKSQRKVKIPLTMIFKLSQLR